MPSPLTSEISNVNRKRKIVKDNVRYVSFYGFLVPQALQIAFFCLPNLSQRNMLASSQLVIFLSCTESPECHPSKQHLQKNNSVWILATNSEKAATVMNNIKNPLNIFVLPSVTDLLNGREQQSRRTKVQTARQCHLYATHLIVVYPIC